MLVWTSELVSEEDDAQRIRATDWLQTVKVLALTATLLAAVDNIGWSASEQRRGVAQTAKEIPPKKPGENGVHVPVHVQKSGSPTHQTTKKFFGDDERQNYFS